MPRLALCTLLGLALAGCASSPPPPPAAGPVDWAAVSHVRVPQLVTRDPGGDERVTKLWLVVVDGQGLIRTSGTRWFRNIERDPSVVLRIAGASHLLRAEPVRDAELKRRANAAFRAKYGIQDRLVHPFGAKDANILRLVERPRK